MSRQKKEDEEEALRKLERNRVAFEGWLARKREEKEKRLKMERKAREEREDYAQRRALANRAYASWLRRKHEEDELAKKQAMVEREMRRLANEKKREERKRAEESFAAWKTQKDEEMRLHKMNTWEGEGHLLTTPHTQELTPSLPGYCSVWSCDHQLADVMTVKVPRGESLILLTNQIAGNNDQQNYTIDHGTK